MPKSGNLPGNADALVRDTIERRLQEQFSAVSAFTTRAGLVLATDGVVLAAYAQLLTNKVWLLNYWSALFIPEILLVIASGFFAFTALSVGGDKDPWRYDPDPSKLYRLAKKKDAGYVEEQAVRSMIFSYEHNKALFERKIKSLKYARYTLYGSGLVFATHLVLFFS